MIFHNYLYRLKCIVRDKETMFWTLLFPIILATLFHLAFSNIATSESFSSINLGIVNNVEYRENLNFAKVMDSVTGSESDAGEENLFNIKYTSTKREADKLLNDNQIAGYIYFDGGLQLFVKGSGINQTIIKSFLDNYKQASATISTIISASKGSADIQKVIEDISSHTDYLKEVAIGKSAPNNVVTYFYALLAMACLYGSFAGMKEVTAIQANLSAEGARVSLVPVNKSKIIISSMFAAISVQFFDILILLGYLILILKVDFGSQLGYVALTCLVGTITGVTYGASISSMVTKSEGLKVGILIGFTMLMSFLSGMMYDGMKYIVSSNLPILAYLNPANLITDSLYALYYYNTYTQFFIDISILCIFAVVLSSITYFLLRRQRYASL